MLLSKVEKAAAEAAAAAHVDLAAALQDRRNCARDMQVAELMLVVRLQHHAC
jgi:hypothetical protein